MQISQYNLDDSIYLAMLQNNTTGYIVFDSNNKFIGCNDIAKECIPGLNDCRVDTFISQEKELGFLCEWIKLFKDSEDSTFAQTLQYKDSYYECVIKALTTDKKIQVILLSYRIVLTGRSTWICCPTTMLSYRSR